MGRIEKIAKAARIALKGVTSAGGAKRLLRHLEAYVQEEGYYLDLKRSSSKVVAKVSSVCDEIFSGGLLVTTSSGLYLLVSGVWVQLLRTPGYGVAVDGLGRIFVVCSAGDDSHIIRGRLDGERALTRLADIKSLCHFKTCYHPERIHQISWNSFNDTLLCANTKRNSLLSIDLDSGEFLDELFPFLDRFGAPVWRDQNHVNGVCAHYDKILFTAHTLGEDRSALGFIDGRRVRMYAHKGRGVHDILLHDNAIMYSDSFRSSQVADMPSISGTVMWRGVPFSGASSIDMIDRRIVVRGLCARRGYLCVGASVNTKRDKRFVDRGGGVFIFNSGELLGFVEGPFSQVYDVLPVDGRRTDQPVGPLKSDDLHEMLVRDVGKCIYDEVVPEKSNVVPPLE